MDPIRLSECVGYALKEFPEFVESLEYDADNIDVPYLFYADLTRFFRTKIENKEKDKISQVFNFLNSFFPSEGGDDESKDLINVQVFEEFASYPETTAASRQFLSPAALKFFEDVFKDYGYEKTSQ